MNIELDGISLNKVGDADVRNIFNIGTSDSRSLIEHKIPGMEGSVIQDLGRSAVRISFEGTFQGKNAKTLLEQLRSKFKQGTPLPFNSDISGAADVTKVIIEELTIRDTAGFRDKFIFSMALREFKEPPPAPTPVQPQDEEAEIWAEEVAEESVESINQVSGKVLDVKGEPKPGIKVLIKGDAGEYEAETDDDGVYRVERLEPGTYKVTIDDEEYAGLEEEVVIGSGQ